MHNVQKLRDKAAWEALESGEPRSIVGSIVSAGLPTVPFESATSFVGRNTELIDVTGLSDVVFL